MQQQRNAWEACSHWLSATAFEVYQHYTNEIEYRPGAN